jgi:hypothetical protein
MALTTIYKQFYPEEGGSNAWNAPSTISTASTGLKTKLGARLQQIQVAKGDEA